MNAETKDKFNRIWNHSIEIREIIEDIPQGDLTSLQRQYLSNAKVLNVVFQQTLIRLAKNGEEE